MNTPPIKLSEKSILQHKFLNNVGSIFTSIEALKINIDDPEFCKAMIEEMYLRKEKAYPYLEQVKELLSGEK